MSVETAARPIPKEVRAKQFERLIQKQRRVDLIINQLYAKFWYFCARFPFIFDASLSKTGVTNPAKIYKLARI
ncbi:hypothetical protein, partial [Staphylococcus felis]|uniref:hypothetical protein n=1 Tax=Staphylococcus felis TaxID=46127 RepID=UPI001EE99059